MKKFLQSTAVAIGSFFAPLAAFAQFGQQNVQGGTDAFDILDTIADILNVVIPILITLGVIYLIWGVVTYITAKEEEDKKNARSVMISGALGLFFILAIWGIIALIGSTLGINVGGNLGTQGMPTITN